MKHILAVLRRLWLGVFLIAATSSLLLLSDVGQRRTTTPMARVAVVQHASQPILEEGVEGMLDALRENGFVDGRNISIQRFNAENDLPTANAIAKQVTSGEFDLVMTASTLSMQTVANANRTKGVPHVFSLVADPYRAGVGITHDSPLSHPKYLVGVGSFLPVDNALRLAQTMLPGLKAVGLPWNAAEANSESFTLAARTACKKLGLELLEANVENSSAVFEAAGSLVARGAQALFITGDVTVLVATDSVVAAAKKGRIPVFTLIPPSVSRGSLFDVGANFHEVGRRSGMMAVQILQGTDPATLPVINFVPERLAVNTTALAGLREPWRIPVEVLEKAEIVVDETGTHRKGEPATAKKVTRKWKIHLVELNNVVDVEEAEHGILDGLKEAGLAEGTDFEMKIRNAQGDMATLNGLVDAALSEGAELLMTLSTPTLQAAMNRSQGRVPIVYTYVASGIAAGAGRSNENHLPYVTGVPVVSAYDEMLQIIHEVLPHARRIGTLFVPAEVNMVFNKDELVEAANRAGFEVIALGVNTSSDVPDAAMALIARDIDAICQIGGNLTAAAFGGIARTANQAKVPVFAFQKSQANEGALVTLARDFYDGGKLAASLAARIMRGEDPKTIPFHPLTDNVLVVNLDAARMLGLTIPDSLVSRADERIGG